MGILNESPIPETYAGPVPWWGNRDDAPSDALFLAEGQRLTGKDMQPAAGLDWTVRTEPVYFYRKVADTADGPVSEPVEVPDQRAIVRNGDEKVLGSATKSYTPIQNGVLFEAIDTALTLTDAHYETAGSLYGGKMVWALAKVDSEFYIRGDGSPYQDFILGLTGHDGRHALVLGATPVRVWCGNTAAMAIEGMTGKYIIRHTANAEKRLEDVKVALEVRGKYLDTYKEAMDALTQRPMTLAEVEAFTEVLLPVNPDVDRPFKTLQMRADIVGLFTSSDNLREVPETAYRALQATMEYADQFKTYGRNGAAADRKAAAIIEGSAFALKSRALGLLQTA